MSKLRRSKPRQLTASSAARKGFWLHSRIWQYYTGQYGLGTPLDPCILLLVELYALGIQMLPLRLVARMWPAEGVADLGPGHDGTAQCACSQHHSAIAISRTINPWYEVF
jgi:hypothetical protein